MPSAALAATPGTAARGRSRPAARTRTARGSRCPPRSRVTLSPLWARVIRSAQASRERVVRTEVGDVVGHRTCRTRRRRASGRSRRRSGSARPRPRLSATTAASAVRRSPYPTTRMLSPVQSQVHRAAIAEVRAGSDRAGPASLSVEPAATKARAETPPAIPRTAATSRTRTPRPPACHHRRIAVRVAGRRRAQRAERHLARAGRAWAASGSRPLCGVELIRPNAACAIARARSRSQVVVHAGAAGRPRGRRTPAGARAPARGPRWAATPSRGPGPRSAAGGAARSRRASRPGRPARPRASAAAATRCRPTGEQLLADRDQHLGEHGVLGHEVLVERRPGDPARGAEVGDRDAVEAARREQLRRGGEDLLARGSVGCAWSRRQG